MKHERGNFAISAVTGKYGADDTKYNHVTRQMQRKYNTVTQQIQAVIKIEWVMWSTVCIHTLYGYIE